jgi:hypothetical protein
MTAAAKAMQVDNEQEPQLVFGRSLKTSRGVFNLDMVLFRNGRYLKIHQPPGQSKQVLHARPDGSGRGRNGTKKASPMSGKPR